MSEASDAGLGPARGARLRPRQVESALLAPLLGELLGRGLRVRLEVDGHSMTPLIRSGDRVTIDPLRRHPPRLGDVLLLAAEKQRLVLHRHVGWAGAELVLRGDCAPASDAAAGPWQVLGVVAGVERRGRRVWAGLGPERRLLAWLSRNGVLRLAARARARVRPVASRLAVKVGLRAAASLG